MPFANSVLGERVREKTWYHRGWKVISQGLGMEGEGPSSSPLRRLGTMIRPTPQADHSASLNRRDLLKLGAASAGVPLLALSPPHSAAGTESAQANPETAPLTDTPPLPGEDHLEARNRTIDNLKLLGLAMGVFAHANNGRFPPAAISKDGKPLLSWRVAILPSLDQKALYGKFHLDEPWDSPHNKSLLAEMPAVYAPVVPKGPERHSTYYQVFVGPGSLFDGEEGTRLTDVTDGLGWTLMVVEAAEPVAWTKPEDVSFQRQGPLPKLGGQFEDGFYVAFADYSARFLSRKIVPETLRALITRNDGEVIDFDKLGPWRPPSR
jgi:hypothetical protein